jgi:hypothetical protein
MILSGLLLFVIPAGAITVSGSNEITIVDDTSQVQDFTLINSNTFTSGAAQSLTAEPGEMFFPYVWIDPGDSFNFTLNVGGETIDGYVDFVTTGWIDADLYICLNGETLVQHVGYIPYSNNERRVEFAYGINMTTGQHYIIAVSDNNYGVCTPIGTLYDNPIIGFTTSNVNGDLRYNILTYSVDDYNQAVDDGVSFVNGSNNLLDYVAGSIGLIGSIFGAFITIITILKVLLIDNFFLVVGLAEGGILIISLRQNPRDIFGFVNDVIQYNTRFISFMVTLLSAFIEGFVKLATIGYQLLKSVPIIGQFL